MRLKVAVVGCSSCLLLLWVLAGCGGGGGGQTTTGATQAGTTTGSPIQIIQIGETDYRLNPNDVTLDRPGTYVFRAVNNGHDIHALRIEGNGIDEQTANINPGQSANLQVDLAAGSYDLDCPVDNHEAIGMDGALTVKEG